MAEKIRRIKEEDFQEVSALFNYRKSVEELKWLFKNPDNQIQYNAFVAVKDDNQLIGVIGFVLSFYSLGINKITGVHPIAWMVLPNYNGLAGISLFRKIIEQGDFSFVIEGSEIAKNLFPMFKLEYKSKCSVYINLLNTKSLYNSLKKKRLLKIIGTIGFLLLCYIRRPSKKLLRKDIALIPYNGNNFVEEKEYDNIFRKKITKNYINWLVDCPTLKTFAFSVKQGNICFGMCVLYVQADNNTRRGRIVHIPFLGFEKAIWVSVIQKCLNIFKREGCHMVTGLAHHNRCHTGYVNSGFINIEKHKPIYFKNTNNKFGLSNLDNWSLQYSEGDEAYRSI